MRHGSNKRIDGFNSMKNYRRSCAGFLLACDADARLLVSHTILLHAAKPFNMAIWKALHVLASSTVVASDPLDRAKSSASDTSKLGDPRSTFSVTRPVWMQKLCFQVQTAWRLREESNLGRAAARRQAAARHLGRSPCMGTKLRPVLW